MFFSSWQTLLRILIVGPLVYAALVVMLRLSGKRTLTQLNAFDFVVTVAFGSTLANTILNTNVALVDGIVALFILICLQLIVAWTTVRLNWSRLVVKSEPCLLVSKGTFLDAVMKGERIRREEILQAIRSQGIASVDDVEFVILETNGKMSVVPRASSPDKPTHLPSALDSVRTDSS